MSTVQIQLPDEVRALADEQLSNGRFRTLDEYIAELIRKDDERRRLETKLMEPLSEPSVEMTDADFERIRERVRAEAAKRRAS